LTEAEEERVGMTLMLLDNRMSRLREHFGLAAEDLNIDLGPLGPLLPRSCEADAHQAFRVDAETQASARILKQAVPQGSRRRGRS
jgi:Gas vesicle protein K